MKRGVVTIMILFLAVQGFGNIKSFHSINTCFVQDRIKLKIPSLNNDSSIEFFLERKVRESQLPDINPWEEKESLSVDSLIFNLKNVKETIFQERKDEMGPYEIGLKLFPVDSIACYRLTKKYIGDKIKFKVDNETMFSYGIATPLKHGVMPMYWGVTEAEAQRLVDKINTYLRNKN
jgi:hypothetical protein